MPEGKEKDGRGGARKNAGRKIDQSKHNRIRQLHASGKGPTEIARELGTSKAQVYRVIEKAEDW